MALEPADERNHFRARITCRASWDVLENIKTRLKGNAMIAFKNSCFGHFMSVEKIRFQGQLYLHLLFRQDTTNSTEKIVYHINGHESVFGPKEFCLITGLNFGNLPSYLTSSSFHKKIFDGKSSINVSDIEYAFEHVCDKYNGDSEWCLKVALLYFLQGILLATCRTTKKIDLNHLHILDDVNKFNLHPWGRVAFDYLISDIRGFQVRFEVFKERKRREYFNVNGFPYAIQVWAYEMMPAIREKYGAPILDKMNAFPRLLRYKAFYRSPSFEGLRTQFFGLSSHIEVHARMKPTSEEKELPWYTSYEAWRTQSQIQNMSNKRIRDAEELDEEAIHLESKSKRREEPYRASEKSEIQDGTTMEQFNKRTRDAEESDEEAIHREPTSKRREEPSHPSEIQDGAMTEQFNKRTRDAEYEEAIHQEHTSERREEPSRASEIQDGAMTEQFNNGTRDAEKSDEEAIHQEPTSKRREEPSRASEIQDGAMTEKFNKRIRDAEESDEEAIHQEPTSKRREEPSRASEIQDGAMTEQFNKRTRDAEESDEEAIHRLPTSKRREEPSRPSEIQDGAMTEQFKNLEKRMTKMFEERMIKIEEKLEMKIDKVIDGLQMVLQEMKQKQPDSKSDHPETDHDPTNDPTPEREQESPQLSHLIQCPALDYLLPFLQRGNM